MKRFFTSICIISACLILSMGACLTNKKQVKDFGFTNVDNDYVESYGQKVTYQPPIVIGFTNPRFVDTKYIVDVVVSSPDTSIEVFGINFRMFYEANDFMSDLRVGNFSGGYGLTVLGQPKVSTGNLASRTILGFEGAMRYVNGAIQLNDLQAAPIAIGASFTKLFEIEVTKIHNEVTSMNSPLVFEKMQDPALGGFLAGSAGVVVTAYINGNRSITRSCIIKTFNPNWRFVGTGTKGVYPYGERHIE